MARLRTLRDRVWIFLLLLVALLGVFGTLDIALSEVVAPGSDPAVVELATTAEIEARNAGRNLLLAAILLALIVVIPYRSGERWAWWAMWVLPLWAIFISLSYVLFIELPTGYPRPAGADSGWLWFLLAGGALLVDRRCPFWGNSAVSGATGAHVRPA